MPFTVFSWHAFFFTFFFHFAHLHLHTIQLLRWWCPWINIVLLDWLGLLTRGIYTTLLLYVQPLVLYSSAVFFQYWAFVLQAWALKVVHGTSHEFCKVRPYTFWIIIIKMLFTWSLFFVCTRLYLWTHCDRDFIDRLWTCKCTNDECLHLEWLRVNHDISISGWGALNNPTILLVL